VPPFAAESDNAAIPVLGFTPRRPLGGEFARKYPASDRMTKGCAILVLPPWRVRKDLWTALKVPR
jgi:hypothetical protein